MSSVIEKEPTREESRTAVLHKIAIHLAEINARNQLEVAVPTLDFLHEIEDKTAADLKKVKAQQGLVDLLTSKEYHERLQNVFTEQFNSLSDEYLNRYLSDLMYEAALSEVEIQLTTSLEEVQQELLYGVFEKPTLQ